MEQEGAALLGLIEELRGHDTGDMPEPDLVKFKQRAFERFKEASGALAKLLLGSSAGSDRYFWRLDTPDLARKPLIGTFALRATDLIEANLGAPNQVAMAASLWPNLELLLELNGEHSYLNGEREEPRLEVILRVNDDRGLEALSILAQLDEFMYEDIAAMSRCKGHELTVCAAEGAIDDQASPPNFDVAIRRAIDAVWDAAKRNDPDSPMPEAVEVRLSLAGGAEIPPDRFGHSLKIMGALFLACDSRLQEMLN